MKDVILLDDQDGPRTSDVIVLDDDSGDDPTGVASGSRPPQPQRVVNGGASLTEEQKKRIAEQKELAALRRRIAQENRSTQSGIPATVSEGLEPIHCGYLNGAVSCYSDERGGGAVGFGVGDGNEAFQGRKRWTSRSKVLDNDVDRGWRSVRKRPAPGHSFGSGMNGNFVNNDRGLVSGAAYDGILSTADLGVAPVGAVSSLRSEQGADKKPQVLSERQESVLRAVRAGSNVFLTGSAGTGKSYVLEHVIKLLREVHGDGVHVTASTGLAACALAGTTLHSFAGVGLGIGNRESLASKTMSRKETFARWRNARALVIDEISMIDGELFDKIDYIGRILRNSSKPFGGIQLIVSGDFYQLPPVKPEKPEKFFAFQADCWNVAFDMQIELDVVFRQSDEDFVAMLNEIRRGRCSPAISKRLQSCQGPVSDNSGVVLTRLYPRRVDVGRENDHNLRALGEPVIVFTALDTARNDFVKNQLANVGAVPVLPLCIGAQVMLAKNLEPTMGLVNGSRGVVVGFTSPGDCRFDYLRKTSGPVSPTGVWPVVRFASSGREMPVTPEAWKILDGDVEVACRTQVPLILAWALSVHKCQGMTLDRVDTDLSRAFDFGMIYVALSRVKCLDGLRLSGFDPLKIKVHPDVSEFYRALADGTNSFQDEG